MSSFLKKVKSTRGIGVDRTCQGDPSRPYYDSVYVLGELPKELPVEGMSARHVASTIIDQHELDFPEKLNTSSYVTVVEEPEEEKVALVGLKVNLADQTVYPSSFDLHDRCVSMIAKLWHAPDGFAGAGCVGSTEACLLAGLALKFRWRAAYAKKIGKPHHDPAVRGQYPNLVISTMFQAAWEKLFKYMDIEPRFVTPSVEGPEKAGAGWRVDPSRVAAEIDDKTIGVVVIMGNHYSGHYDPVLKVAEVVRAVNKAKGLDVGIHVDAASGGFVAPFQDGLEKWDFRVPEVLSISASGHKFGQSCCGTGWVVWRERDDLADHVAISVSYLGGSADSFTLNFSRPATGVYVQFYKFLRLGASGYRRVCDNMMAVAARIRSGIAALKRADGTPFVQLLDAGDTHCLPVVTARVNPALDAPYDDIDLQHAIAQEHWYVCGYKMSMRHPVTEETHKLFFDAEPDTTMFRVVVKANLTMPMANNLVESVAKAFEFLEAHGKGYSSHPHHAYKDGHKAC
mmetsp:Transcript_9973/g.30205  ORF Transcript_9973/g.30205 Transcript_9973/m.30205 type:complete len:512 (-) Transcript_9973:91-1626(-)